MLRPFFTASAALFALAVTTYLFALSQFTAIEQRRADNRVQLYRSTLLSALQRFQHLPFILSSDPFVEAGLKGDDADSLNRRLETFANASGLEAIYLMDPKGDTVAASNFATEQSFVGQNYGFRPYFRDALAGKRGEFYAIGATTSRPGYFIAEAVGRHGMPEGVLAVKLGLNDLQEDWRRGGETVFVSNADGVVVLASEPSWLYRSLEALSPDQRATIKAERQFADEPLTPLDWRATPGTGATVDGADHLHATAEIDRLGWRIHHITERRPVTVRAALTGGAAAAIALILLSVVLFLRSERLREALDASQRHRRELRIANQEIARTSKLVALGQLSASVAHEFGQPLSALRNYLAVIELSDAAGPLRGTTEKIRGLSDRMERLLRELRQFAQPAPRRADAVDPRRVVDGARELLAHDFAAAGVDLEIRVSEGAVAVAGDAMALEQALVNLLRNALTAMADHEGRRVRLCVRRDADWLEFAVSDDGAGIGEATIEKLSEPFHTTRASGEGMGLGLAIVSAIVKQHDGTLSATNRDGGGAIFAMRLPIAEAGRANGGADR